MKSVRPRRAVIIAILIALTSSKSTSRRAALFDPGDVISTKHIDVAVTPHAEPPQSIPKFAERLDVTFDVDSESVKKRFNRLSGHDDVRLSTIGPNRIEDVTSLGQRQWATYRSDDDEAAMLVKKDTRGRLVLEGSLRHRDQVYLIQPTHRSRRHAIHTVRQNSSKINAPKINGKQRDLNKYVVELVTIFDYSMLQRWRKTTPKGHNDIERLKEYAAIIVNEMAYRYRSLYQYGTDITVELAHVLVVTDPANNPYDTALIKDGSVDYTKLLGSFERWVNTNLIPGDDILLFTGYKFIPYSSVGAAYYAGACGILNQGVISAEASLYGTAMIAAHELGHNLDIKHDEDKGCYGLKIMKTLMFPIIGKTRPAKNWRFSNCSREHLNDFLKFLNNDGRNCLLTRIKTSFSNISDANNTEVNQSGTRMWGAELTLDQQCHMLRPNYSFCGDEQLKYPTARICYGLFCGDPNEKKAWCHTFIPHTGTPCGHYKVCKYDRCVKSSKGLPLNEKCPYGEVQRGFIGEDRLTCQEALAKDPGYCYYHEKACCVSCPLLVKNPAGSCTYGDYPMKWTFRGKIFMNCTEAVREHPGMCYKNSYVCCESCPQVFDQSKPSCNFGDRIQKFFFNEKRYDGCKDLVREHPNVCYEKEDICCASCPLFFNASSPGCEYGNRPLKFKIKKYSTCEDAVAARSGFCYDDVVETLCCKSCGEVKYRQKGCKYGDKLGRQVRDPKGRWRGCRAIKGYSSFYCYKYADSCCARCSRLKKDIPGCEYGDRRFGCKRALKTYPSLCTYYGKICCETCSRVNITATRSP